MFNISSIYKNTPLTSYLVFVQARFKSKVHWAKLKKKTSPKYKALNHFDDFYGSIFGDKWQGMREAMLRRSKYVAVINNYGDTEETMEYLTQRGAHCLKRLITAQQDFHNQYPPTPTPASLQPEINRMEAYMDRQKSEEIARIYPKSDNIPERLEFKGNELDNMDVMNNKVEKKELPHKTLEQSLIDAEIDETRIIDPSLGVTSESLYQFLPATKLKGMDDWVSESVNYSYFNIKDKDFPLIIEPDAGLSYPEHLKVFTYEMDSDINTFPEPKRCQTGVFNYYPMDCGSVLAVLALGLSPGDRVLDLCSAPGGKALVALQTLLPDVVICNDISISRSNRIHKIFRDYLFDFDTNNKWRERVMFSRVDGRHYVDDIGFDKILVDVPCTTDRHTVNVDDNNIFRPDRIKERLRIPEMQSQLLVNALNLVKVGGTVVYSTCSLSPAQNDGVVHMALKRAFETHSLVVSIKDMTASVVGLSSTLALGTGSAAPKYGQLVVPSVGANFGPSYIAKLIRIR